MNRTVRPAPLPRVRIADVAAATRVSAITAAGFETVIDTTEYDEQREVAGVCRLTGWSPAAVALTGVHHSTRLRGPRATGLSVPGGFAVAGFDGLNFTTVLPTPLTALRSPRHHVGMIGARNILARIHGVVPERDVCLSERIVPGGTG